jgi:hypothetical protein
MRTPTRNLWLPVLLVSAVALTVGIGVGVARRPAETVTVSPASLKDSCGADVLFFGVRGSGELPDDHFSFGATTYDTERAMSSALRPLNVVGEAVDYPAISVLEAVKTGHRWSVTY